MAEEQRIHIKKPDRLKINFRAEKISQGERNREGQPTAHHLEQRELPEYGFYATKTGKPLMV